MAQGISRATKVVLVIVGARSLVVMASGSTVVRAIDAVSETLHPVL